MSTTDARLLGFQRVVEADGFETVVVPRSGDQPADTLLVALTGDDGQLAWQLELSFIPGMEAQLDGLGLLQSFVAIASDVGDDALPGLRDAIVRLNTQLPLVGFGLVAEPSMAIYRCVAMIPSTGDGADAVVLQTTWLIAYLLSEYGAVVAAVASGTPFGDALAGHRHAQLFV